MNKFKRIVHSKQMVTFVWIIGIIALWEIFAFIVAATKRSPLNVLPHLYQIIGSFFSTDKVTSDQTMAQLIGLSCRETLLRAGLGFVIGTVAGHIIALLMSLSVYDCNSHNSGNRFGGDKVYRNHRYENGCKNASCGGVIASRLRYC